ncbi:MAG TPA: family 10 glycosylhydrolase [bacterium]|nr:family 10 glycosylhydrolase [bacterium]HPO52476.1 family 10 glycosylhydrolase [bacterium]
MKRVNPVKKDDGLYFADMSKCYPSSAISEKRSRKTWKKFHYETEKMSGILLVACYGVDPPVLSLPVKVKGRYKVFVGLYGEHGFYAGIRIKLKKDHCFHHLVSRNSISRGDTINEVFWKEAEMIDEVIEIAPYSKKDDDRITSGIAYIRLVPAEEKTEPDRKPDIYLAAFNDAYSFIYYHRPVTKKEIQEQIEVFRDTPFKKIYWGMAAGDVATYPTNIGSRTNIDLDVYPRIGDRNYAESCRILRNKKFDILKIAVEHAKKIGLEFHVYHRLGFVTGQPPWEEMMYSKFFYKNQKFLCYDRDGTKISRLSYAYPEVQQHCINLYKEVASYGIDGINFAFHRGVPLVLFEKPIVEGFKSRFGEDPRKLPDTDQRLFQFRSSIITGYLERVRKEFPWLELAATVLINEANNRFYNLDIKNWIDKKIIDVLIPYGQDRGLAHKGVIDMEYFSKLTKGTSCQLCPELRAVRSWMTPEQHYVDMASYFYKYDIDGICFWDIESRFVFPKEWRIINELCWKKGLKSRINRIKDDFRDIPLKTLNGYAANRYPFWWSY